jgi:hypothetical protein
MRKEWKKTLCRNHQSCSLHKSGPGCLSSFISNIISHIRSFTHTHTHTHTHAHTLQAQQYQPEYSSPCTTHGLLSSPFISPINTYWSFKAQLRCYNFQKTFPPQSITTKLLSPSPLLPAPVCHHELEFSVQLPSLTCKQTIPFTVEPHTLRDPAIITHCDMPCSPLLPFWKSHPDLPRPSDPQLIHF